MTVAEYLDRVVGQVAKFGKIVRSTFDRVVSKGSANPRL